MARYLARRLLIAVPTLVALSFLIFALVSSAPGDPAEEYARRQSGSQEPSPAQIDDAREELRLDRPFLVQYGLWLKGALTGDLGRSFTTRTPVAEELGSRIGPTFEVAFASMLFIVVVALPLGVIAAMFHRHWSDQLLRVGALFGASIPTFFFAYLMIIEFATNLKLLPVAGRQGTASLIMPAVVLAATPAAIISRLLRASLLEVFGEDYVRTARSKGLSSVQVVMRHALRNGAIPVTTYLGIALGTLLEGVVITEFIFAWPGLGQLAAQSISQRDYPMIQAVVVFIGVMYFFVNFAVDLTYRLIDPRIRLDARIEHI